MEFPVDELLFWFSENKRDLPWRGCGDIYKIWVSEVMLQQTQVSTVIPYFRRFLRAFPDVEALAKADSGAVLKSWEGLGYYNRCRNLHRAAAKVMSEFSGRIPCNARDFGSLPGVGPYILAAVMSIGCGLPLPAVDGNVIRVYCRFKGITYDVRRPEVKTRIAKELQEIIPPASPGDFNEAMIEVGALICKPKNPLCDSCPFRSRCEASLSGQLDVIPFKSPRKKAPVYRVSIAVILQGEKFYIQERPAGGHLGGMWEFPGGKSKGRETPDQTLVRECREELGVDVGIIRKLSEVKHAYTHFKIEMSVFLCRLPGEQVIDPVHGLPFRWITVEQLEEFPFPGANHKFFPALREVFSAAP